MINTELATPKCNIMTCDKDLWIPVSNTFNLVGPRKDFWCNVQKALKSEYCIIAFLIEFCFLFYQTRGSALKIMPCFHDIEVITKFCSFCSLFTLNLLLKNWKLFKKIVDTYDMYCT